MCQTPRCARCNSEQRRSRLLGDLQPTRDPTKILPGCTTASENQHSDPKEHSAVKSVTRRKGRLEGRAGSRAHSLFKDSSSLYPAKPSGGSKKEDDKIRLSFKTITWSSEWTTAVRAGEDLGRLFAKASTVIQARDDGSPP